MLLAPRERRSLQSGSGRISKVLEHVRINSKTKPNVGPFMKWICRNGAAHVPPESFPLQKRKVHGNFRCKAAVGESMMLVRGWKAGMTIF